MSEDLEKEIGMIDKKGQEKLKELIEKDAKSARKPTGLWNWITALLGASMVIFYFYTAGITTVATQYHRGVYVFITYVLVFLLYPAGKLYVRIPINLFIGFVLSSALALFLFYGGDTVAFHDHLLVINKAWRSGGFGAAISAAFQLWALGLGSIVIAIPLLFIDKKMAEKWKENPTLSDILLALISVAVIYYWIHEFESLNYRAGAETELDAMISIIGVLISLEICRRVLGWSMTFIGIFMICYAYFGPYFPEVLAHRGFGFERLSNALYLSTNGVFGVMANVLATYVILFIFFGAFPAQIRGWKILHRPAHGYCR